jgi:hypothetical protein
MTPQQEENKSSGCTAMPLDDCPSSTVVTTPYHVHHVAEMSITVGHTDDEVDVGKSLHERNKQGREDVSLNRVGLWRSQLQGNELKVPSQTRSLS